jgi:hypothetical protein
LDCNDTPGVVLIFGPIQRLVPTQFRHDDILGREQVGRPTKHAVVLSSRKPLLIEFVVAQPKKLDSDRAFG